MSEAIAKESLGSLCELFTDGDWVETKDQSIDGIRLIQTGNVGNGQFKDRLSKARYISEETFDRLKCEEIFAGDCLISRLPDPVGRCCILPEVPGRMITAVDCTIVRFKKPTILPEYFCYYSQTDSYLRSVENFCTGATRKRISRKNLAKIEIPVPSLPEQNRIVAILDEAFGAIDRAKEIATQNVANARELFESYLNRVFSEKGEGWGHSGESLNDLCDLIVDCEHKTAPTQETGIPSIRTPNIGKGELLLDGVKRVSDDVYAQWTRRAEPKPGDLILAREAPAGNIAVIPENTKVCLGQRTVLIRPRKDVFEPLFLAYLILEPETQKRLQSHATGATVQHINLRDIRGLKIDEIPDLATQREVCKRVKFIYENGGQLAEVISLKLTALDELKQSILQKAFTGQLTAKSPELEAVP